MRIAAAAPAALALDFNVMVANLNKVDKAQALELIDAAPEPVHLGPGVRRYAEEFRHSPFRWDSFSTNRSGCIRLFWPGWTNWKGSWRADEGRGSKRPHHSV